MLFANKVCMQRAGPKVIPAFNCNSVAFSGTSDEGERKRRPALGPKKANGAAPVTLVRAVGSELESLLGYSGLEEFSGTSEGERRRPAEPERSRS